MNQNTSSSSPNDEIPAHIAPTIWTVGHGTKTIGQLRSILDAYSIDSLVDVRLRPFSKYNPQFNMPAMREEFGKRYVWAGKSLGNPSAFAGSQKIDPEVFERAINMLIDRARRRVRIALMCSESDWKKCHRHFMIAKALDRKNVVIVHITVDKNGVVADDYVRYPDEIKKGTPSRLSFKSS